MHNARRRHYEPHTRYSSSAGWRRRSSAAAQAAYPHKSRARRSPYPRSRVVIDAPAPHPRYPHRDATYPLHILARQRTTRYAASERASNAPSHPHTQGRGYIRAGGRIAGPLFILPLPLALPSNPRRHDAAHTTRRLSFATTSTPTKPRRIKVPASVASCTVPHPRSATPSNACAQYAARAPLAAPTPQRHLSQPARPCQERQPRARGPRAHDHSQRTLPIARTERSSRDMPARSPHPAVAIPARSTRETRSGVRRPRAAARRRDVRGAGRQ
ncbi:hypothetical protein C8J57DRAFT_1281408 [Mycena rebaudengoi]|nr:hypothetical protein C8J57DRAFT_1281408 [Mycena rebaudengoi]